MNQTLFETEFKDIKLLKRGKVRDVYDLGDQILMVASDRISAFDVVMPDTIPQKGKDLDANFTFLVQSHGIHLS
jgi:phosphoribosylaminoimidazole-succinocarboxamide synthase